MVTIETTPERGAELKQIVENALTYAVITNRGVLAGVGMASMGTDLTPDERDAVIRQVDTSLSEVMYARQQLLEFYTPIVNVVRVWIGAGDYSIPVSSLKELVEDLEEWETYQRGDE